MRGVIKVAVVETDVLGVKAYHYRCMECGEEGKRKDREVQAVKMAKAHAIKHVKEQEREVIDNGVDRD